jgi:hypothetical protein
MTHKMISRSRSAILVTEGEENADVCPRCGGDGYYYVDEEEEEEEEEEEDEDGEIVEG